MNRLSNQETQDILQRLRAARCPVDEVELPQWNRAEIQQVGSIVASELIEQHFNTFYIIRLGILARKSFRFDRFTIEGQPWDHQLFNLLTTNDEVYRFPNCKKSFEQKHVWNHFAEQNTRMASGDYWEKYLLAQGCDHPSLKLPFNGKRHVIVSLYDTFQQVASCKCELKYSRLPQEQKAIFRPEERHSLFERDDAPNSRAAKNEFPEVWALKGSLNKHAF